jgi:small subunit ribosomal protein S25e
MSETKKDTKSSWNKPKETSDAKSSKNTKNESIGDITHGLALPEVDETKLKDLFGGTKAITLYETSRILNVNASVANKFLNDLESKNLIIRVGGYSGHYIWKLIE